MEVSSDLLSETFKCEIMITCFLKLSASTLDSFKLGISNWQHRFQTVTEASLGLTTSYNTPGSKSNEIQQLTPSYRFVLLIMGKLHTE